MTAKLYNLNLLNENYKALFKTHNEAYKELIRSHAAKELKLRAEIADEVSRIEADGTKLMCDSFGYREIKKKPEPDVQTT